MIAFTEPFGKSYYCSRNYRDYLKRKFTELAKDITHETGTTRRCSIVDFGCGYGGLVNALWENGYHRIHGTDISQWAIEHGQKIYPHLVEKLQFYNRDLLRSPNQLLIILDVLEHMPAYEIQSVLKLGRIGARGKVAVRIPVSAHEGEPFVLPVSNNDPTHISCHTKEWWDCAMKLAGFRSTQLFRGSAIYDSPGVLAAIYE